MQPLNVPNTSIDNLHTWTQAGTGITIATSGLFVTATDSAGDAIGAGAVTGQGKTLTVHFMNGTSVTGRFASTGSTLTLSNGAVLPASNKIAFVLGDDGVGRVVRFNVIADLFPQSYMDITAIWSSEAVLHQLPSGGSLGQSLKLPGKDGKSWMLVTANGQLVSSSHCDPE